MSDKVPYKVMKQKGENKGGIAVVLNNNQQHVSSMMLAYHRG